LARLRLQREQLTAGGLALLQPTLREAAVALGLG